MHERIGYRKKYHYLNLRPEDKAIWERFILKYPDQYLEVIYNLHVGEGAEIPDGTDPVIANDFKLLTQYKIDVVGFNEGVLDIIELKPRAGASTIGQVLSYVELYKKHIDPEAKPRAIIVTDEIRPDIEDLAEKFKINLITV